MAVLYGGEAIIDVSHVPVHPVEVLSATQEVKVAVKHLPLQIIVMVCDTVEWNVPLLSYLMD
jgi:hypothetical protein